MNILFICHRLPFPPDRGGKIRPFYFIKHLHQSHQVTVVSLAETQEEVDNGHDLRKYCHEVIVEKMSSPVRWVKAFAGLPTSSPSSLRYFQSAKLMKRIHQLGEFDAVMVHCAFVAPYALTMNNAPLIMDFGDLDSGKLFEYEKFRAFPLSWAYGYEARKLRAYESWISNKAKFCTFTTPYELDEFGKFNDVTPRKVIPNGVNTNYFEWMDDVTYQSESLVFVGRLDYFPNEQGIQWFVRNVLPILQKVLPKVSLTIVGSNPSTDVQRLAEVPGIRVTGHVPDVRPFLREATLAIAPLHIARGVQNKILEAMAIGTPIVATEEAARGIHASEQQCLLIGKTPEDFAKQVVRVFKEAGLRRALSENGRKHIQNHYTWKQSMEILDQVLVETLNG